MVLNKTLLIVTDSQDARSTSDYCLSSCAYRYWWKQKQVTLYRQIISWPDRWGNILSPVDFSLLANQFSLFIRFARNSRTGLVMIKLHPVLLCKASVYWIDTWSSIFRCAPLSPARDEQIIIVTYNRLHYWTLWHVCEFSVDRESIDCSLLCWPTDIWSCSLDGSSQEQLGFSKLISKVPGARLQIALARLHLHPLLLWRWRSARHRARIFRVELRDAFIIQIPLAVTCNYHKYYIVTWWGALRRVSDRHLRVIRKCGLCFGVGNDLVAEWRCVSGPVSVF